MVYAVYPDNSKVVFEGSQGAERKVRIEHHNVTTFYKGAKGLERKETRQLNGGHDEPNGATERYEGDKDVERLVSIELHDGTVRRFAGEKGMEVALHDRA